MCPPDYHHNGFLATHAWGQVIYGYIYLYVYYIYIIYLYIYIYICICIYTFYKPFIIVLQLILAEF